MKIIHTTPNLLVNFVKNLGNRGLSLFIGIIGIMTFWKQSAQAECFNKIDIGPAFVHLDILESGHTVKRMDMWAVRGDASWFCWKGLFVKPTLLYGNGGSAKGGIFSGSLGIGHYTPLGDCFAAAPSIGIIYTHIWTHIDIPFLMLEGLQERFKSWSPYLGLELYWKICQGWRLSGSFQYAWSRTHTSIEHIVRNAKSDAKGPNYGILLEHDLNECWSVNIGAAYNLSLSKEKHGIRGTGVKLGVAYWF